jgi:hypothetical protein
MSVLPLILIVVSGSLFGWFCAQVWMSDPKLGAFVTLSGIMYAVCAYLAHGH